MKNKTFAAGILLAFLLFFSGQEAEAQNYSRGIGIRAGFYSGLTYKQLVAGTNSIEVIGALGTGESYCHLAAIYQWNFPLGDVDNLSWHIGPGVQANIGLDDSAKSSLGGQGNIGVEFQFPGVPLTLGLDYNLAVNFIGDKGVGWDGIGLAFRYVW